MSFKEPEGNGHTWDSIDTLDIHPFPSTNNSYHRCSKCGEVLMLADMSDVGARHGEWFISAYSPYDNCNSSLLYSCADRMMSKALG